MQIPDNDSIDLYSSAGGKGVSEDIPTIQMDDGHSNVVIGKSSVMGQRSTQQDTIMADDDYAYREREKAIAVLCDGMGGLSGGEQASQLCAANLFQEFHIAGALEDVPAFFRATIPQLDADVQMLTQEDGTPLNAGTTLVSTVITDGCLYWASVGDSHIYIIRGDEILCITQEHNFLMLLNERVKRGEITAEEAQAHPKKEALVSYIGMGGVRYVDMNSKPFLLLDGDYMVLCSDGLYRTLEDAEIKDIVCKAGPEVQLAAEKLTEAAIGKGIKHQDNTSVVVMQYQDAGNNSI